jgi:hypothetical protein
MQSRRGSCQCLLAQADAPLHAPRGLTVCPGVAIGVAGSTHQGGSPRGLSSIASDRFSVSGPVRQAPDPPISLRRQCAMKFVSPRQPGGVAYALSPSRRFACGVPHTSCATPASAPDILSSDAFQDLPSSGAGVFYQMGGGPMGKGHAYPPADCAKAGLKRGFWIGLSPNRDDGFRGIWRGGAWCGLVNSSPAKRGKYGEAGMGASYVHVRVRSRSVNPTRPHRLAALPRSTSPVSQGKSCTGVCVTLGPDFRRG